MGKPSLMREAIPSPTTICLLTVWPVSRQSILFPMIRKQASPTWHTIHDNMDHIDKNTLKAVGQTVLEVIYNEK